VSELPKEFTRYMKEAAKEVWREMDREASKYPLSGISSMIIRGHIIWMD
jgi:hypothetical protein